MWYVCLACMQVGVQTLYNFWAYFGPRLRLSQVLVLEPWQGGGMGKEMLACAYRMAHALHAIDLTVSMSTARTHAWMDASPRHTAHWAWCTCRRCLRDKPAAVESLGVTCPGCMGGMQCGVRSAAYLPPPPTPCTTLGVCGAARCTLCSCMNGRKFSRRVHAVTVLAVHAHVQVEDPSPNLQRVREKLEVEMLQAAPWALQQAQAVRRIPMAGSMPSLPLPASMIGRRCNTRCRAQDTHCNYRLGQPLGGSMQYRCGKAPPHRWTDSHHPCPPFALLHAPSA